jgi:histidine triad (HIT) family protein
MTLWVKRILQSIFVQKIISWIFSRQPRLLPVKPLRETPNWLAFSHPTPAYPVHLVVTPKTSWKTWMEVDADEPGIFTEFIELTQSMIRDFELEPAGYRLILNGGPHQTFPHLHFHLVAGDPLPEKDEST